jgi:hypothetical protein
MKPQTMSINPKGIPPQNVGRDGNGRFCNGNQGGPGNPFARKVAALRNALLDSVSEEDLKDIIDILKTKARQGDTAAFKLILQYCVSKPAPANDSDRVYRPIDRSFSPLLPPPDGAGLA